MNAVRALRTQRGLQPEDLASLAGIDNDRLTDIEKGASLTSSEERSLSEILGVPRFALLGADINVAPIPHDFRTVANQAARPERQGLAAIYRAQALQSFLTLAIGSRPDDPPPTSFAFLKSKDWKSQNRIDELSAEVRKISKYQPERHSGEDKGPYNLFNLLKYNIEKCDISVICERLDYETYRGFCLNDPHNPIIHINTSRQPYRTRIFTLVHELVHLMIDETGIVDLFNFHNEIERFCNKVTIESLAPRAYFEKACSNIDFRSSELDIVELISRKIPISKMSIAIRIEEVFQEKGFTSRWLSKIKSIHGDDIPEKFGDDFDLSDHELISITGYDGEDLLDDEEIEDNESIWARHTRASYQVARLGLRTISILNNAVKGNLVSAFDAGSFGNFRPSDFDSIVSSYERKLSEVRRNADRPSED